MRRSVPPISIIIVNWNGEAHLPTCLDALTAQSASVGWSGDRGRQCLCGTVTARTTSERSTRGWN